MPRENVQPPTERGLEKHMRMTTSVTRLSERRRISARIPSKAPSTGRTPRSLTYAPSVVCRSDRSDGWLTVAVVHVHRGSRVCAR